VGSGRNSRQGGVVAIAHIFGQGRADEGGQRLRREIRSRKGSLHAAKVRLPPPAMRNSASRLRAAIIAATQRRKAEFQLPRKAALLLGKIYFVDGRRALIGLEANKNPVGAVVAGVAAYGVGCAIRASALVHDVKLARSILRKEVFEY
jgi:hypothetical protein